MRGEPRVTQRGFTMIELLVGTAVAALLLVAGVPGFCAYIASQRTSTAAQMALHDVMMARAESSRTGLATSLQPTEGDWQAGWSVSRADVNEDGNLQETSLAERALAGELVTSICSTDGTLPARLEFDAIGGLRVPATGAVIQFRARVASSESVREIRIDPSGRAHVWRRDDNPPQLTCT